MRISLSVVMVVVTLVLAGVSAPLVRAADPPSTISSTWGR